MSPWLTLFGFGYVRLQAASSSKYTVGLMLVWLVLASAFTCLADSNRASLFKIISSINERDDLVAGKSYSVVEAEQLFADGKTIRRGAIENA